MFRVATTAQPRIDDIDLTENGEKAAPPQLVLERVVDDGGQDGGHVSDAHVELLELMLAHALTPWKCARN